MASNIYGSYEEKESKTNTTEEDVYYEDELEKKHLYKEIEFAVDVDDSIIYIIGEIEDFGLYNYIDR